MAIDWKAQLGEQLDWYWHGLLRPRLEGLTDDEYFWEPVPGCWTVRPGLERKLGRAAGPFSEEPFAALILHVNREVFHHAAEVALLRDLYRWRVAP